MRFSDPSQPGVASVLLQIEALDANWRDDPAHHIGFRVHLIQQLAQACAASPREAVKHLAGIERVAQATAEIETQLLRERANLSAAYQAEDLRLRRVQQFEEPEGGDSALLDRLG